MDSSGIIYQLLYFKVTLGADFARWPMSLPNMPYWNANLIRRRRIFEGRGEEIDAEFGAKILELVKFTGVGRHNLNSKITIELSFLCRD